VETSCRDSVHDENVGREVREHARDHHFAIGGIATCGCFSPFEVRAAGDFKNREIFDNVVSFAGCEDLDVRLSSDHHQKITCLSGDGM